MTLIRVDPSQVALAVSLNLRTYLRLKTTTTGKVSINLPNIDTFLCWDLSELKRLIPYSYGKEWCRAGDCSRCFYCCIMHPIIQDIQRDFRIKTVFQSLFVLMNMQYQNCHMNIFLSSPLEEETVIDIYGKILDQINYYRWKITHVSVDIILVSIPCRLCIFCKHHCLIITLIWSLLCLDLF